MVIRARLERATYCLEGSCSIQLSYRTNYRKIIKQIVDNRNRSVKEKLVSLKALKVSNLFLNSKDEAAFFLKETLCVSFNQVIPVYACPHKGQLQPELQTKWKATRSIKRESLQMNHIFYYN